MSKRFKFEGKYAMRVIDGKGSLLAYFNVVDVDLGIEFRDVRLIEGKNGVFVGAPFRSYEDKKSGETKYADYWRPAFEDDARSEEGMAYVEEMAEAAHEHYLSIVDEEEERPRRKAKPKPKSRQAAEEDDEDEDDEDERPARRKPAAAKKKTRVAEEEEDDEDEDEDERPAPKAKSAKTTRRTTGRGPVPTSGRKAKADVDDDELPF